MKKINWDNWIKSISYIYILVPFIIFVLCWMKPYYGIPISIAVVCCLVKIIKQQMMKTTDSIFDLKDYKVVLGILGIIILWVCMSGIGGVAYQTKDHAWRNTLFEVLVQKKWPVTQTVMMDNQMVTRGVSYYIGFWLPAAAAGKIFGIQFGWFCQVLWAILGIFLFYMAVCRKIKKVKLWPLILFIFFSGMDIVGCYLVGFDVSNFHQYTHLEWWTAFQFSSFTTQLFWVFNQAIPAWLTVMLLLEQKSNKIILLLYSSMFINCSFPAIGMIPFLLYKMCVRKYGVKRFSKEWFGAFLKNTATLENVIGVVIGIVCGAFLIRSGASEEGISITDFSNGGWLVLLIFLLSEVVLLCVLIYPYCKKTIFWIMMACFIICPSIQIYGDKNFCMRASIPALLVLFLLVLRTIDEGQIKRDKKRFIALIIVLAIGAITPMHELIRSTKDARNGYLSENTTTFHKEKVEAEEVYKNDYESVDVDKSLFYRYLAE